MSDTESLFEDFNEDVISTDRELIAMVRANRFLYDKTEKLYANGNVKTEAWVQIGASLTHPLEGPAAEKKFYTLRQRFGKERRKVVQSMLRSGAGADQPTYTPTWLLYKDLTFLEDIIKPRKTSSNYKSKVSANSQMSILRTSSSSTSMPSDDQVITLRTISPFSSASANSDMFSQNSNLLTNFTGTDESSTDVSEGHFSSSSATPYPATPSPVTPTSATSSSVISGVGSNNTVAQVQRAMSNISTKRKVPPSDSFAIKKRQEADAVNKSLIEQSKGLTELAAKIGQAIIASPSPQNTPSVINNVSSDTQAMLSTIGFALSVISEHAQLECVIGILQYINDFSKKSE